MEAITFCWGRLSQTASETGKPALLEWLCERHYAQAQPVVASSHKTSERDRVNIWTLRGLT